MQAKGCNMQSDHIIPRVPSLASKPINKFTDGASKITIEILYSLLVLIRLYVFVHVTNFLLLLRYPIRNQLSIFTT